MEIDVSEVLKAGVYVLRLRGKVMFVGWAKSMIGMVNAHQYNRARYTPVWDPIVGVQFDSASVIPCGPDRAKSILADLIAEHDPIYNRPINLEEVRCSLATTRPRTSSVSGR